MYPKTKSHSEPEALNPGPNAFILDSMLTHVSGMDYMG